jgi:hypothetical protein
MAEKARVGHQKGLRGALATQRQPLQPRKEFASWQHQPQRLGWNRRPFLSREKPLVALILEHQQREKFVTLARCKRLASPQ